MEPGNRKITRPPFTGGKDARVGEGAPPPARRAPVKKPVPPDQTNAENFYYIKQMQGKTQMTIVLKDGEQLNGIIEWYDKASIKVNRADGPNLLVYKSYIKYMYKA